MNTLDVVDRAVFKDEPMRFMVGPSYLVAAKQLGTDIQAMRDSGELDDIIGRIRLEEAPSLF